MCFCQLFPKERGYTEPSPEGAVNGEEAEHGRMAFWVASTNSARRHRRAHDHFLYRGGGGGGMYPHWFTWKHLLHFLFIYFTFLLVPFFFVSSGCLRLVFFSCPCILDTGAATGPQLIKSFSAVCRRSLDGPSRRMLREPLPRGENLKRVRW